MSVTATNLAALTAYPLTPGGYSVDNDNIQKLRVFKVSDVRRWWSIAATEVSDTAFIGTASKPYRWYSTVTIP